MLIPLAGLALGATFAGVVFRHWFIGGGFEGFWRNSLFVGPDNHILEEMEHVPCAGLAVADADDARSGSSSRSTCIWSIGQRRSASPMLFPPLYQFLLNKWYFDELYDAIFVRPAFAIGRLFWKGGDGASSTAWGRTGSRRGCST